jgi:Zn-dependent protease with chaperone function
MHSMQDPSSSGRTRDHGSFFDGQTARANAVTVNVLSEGIQIYGGRAKSLGYWSYDGLQAAPGTRADSEINLMHREHPDARLLITDPGILGQLRNMTPNIFRHQGTRRGLVHRFVQIALIIGIIAALIYVVVPKTAHVIAGAIPVKWETAWGKSFRNGLTSRLKVCRGEVGVAALNAMTAQLLRAGPVRTSAYEITVTVVEVSTQNAFATMGGQIVVFSRLIEEMDGPDELAGVLAHEIAHVIARHPLSHTIESIATMTFTGNLGSGTSDVGGALALSAYSRTKEAEADRIASQILGDAGISPRGLAKFFQRLQKAAKGDFGGAGALFNTHPALAERAAALTDRGAAPTRPALNAAQWRALRRICD